MNKKTVVAAVAVVALAVGGGLAWRDWGQADQGGALVLQGNVDVRQVSLAFNGSGRVAALHVDAGDAVQQGQVLAVLDTDALRLQADQAQAQVAVQQQQLRRLRAGSRPEEIAQARSRVTAAAAEATRARQELARLQGLAADTGGRGVSALDVERAQASTRAAEARLAELRQALRLAEVGPRSEDVDAGAAQLQAAEAQLTLLRYQIEQGELRAPQDAMVRSRLLEPGDMATPQRPVFALALTQPKWVRVYVSEPDLGRVKPGMAAQVVTDGQPAQRFDGQVGYIASVAEFTPKSVQTTELRTSLVYEVRVQVQDAADALRLGQPVTVRLLEGAVAPAAAPAASATPAASAASAAPAAPAASAASATAQS